MSIHRRVQILEAQIWRRPPEPFSQELSGLYQSGMEEVGTHQDACQSCLPELGSLEKKFSGGDVTRKPHSCSCIFKLLSLPDFQLVILGYRGKRVFDLLDEAEA